MEWTFLANVMQAYTGNKENLFARVSCMASKQHMFWVHHLREPFSTKEDGSAVQHCAGVIHIHRITGVPPGPKSGVGKQAVNGRGSQYQLDPTFTPAPSTSRRPLEPRVGHTPQCLTRQWRRQTRNRGLIRMAKPPPPIHQQYCLQTRPAASTLLTSTVAAVLWPAGGPS